jgi:2-hydroxychromene-2-carboxylate isomerase
VSDTTFSDQGGAASSEPSWLRRWFTSQLMRRLADPARRQRKRAAAEQRRLRRGEPQRVTWFHDVADPYSHLGAQLLSPLLARYEIELDVCLVSAQAGPDTPEPALLAAYARRDAAAVAPYRGLEFPDAAAQPSNELCTLAGRILAGSGAVRFAALAPRVGQALWGSDAASLTAMAAAQGAADEATRAQCVQMGNALRKRLGHYAGAMFHYAGEWYWGVDRLCHLEERLRALGALRDPASALVAPRPSVRAPESPLDGELRLEFFASLRSPYTSIVFDRTVALARASGVRLALRPVLPMVMRGVPVTLNKGRYIFFDTAREAEAEGLRWGHAWDPIGEPVRQLYSLLPWARAQGREVELLGAALQAAFFEAKDLGHDSGLAEVVRRAGLSWEAARAHRADRGWLEEVERNRRVLYEAGLWGVPAFRLLDASRKPLLETWGQDRLWLVSRKIAEAAQETG